MSTFLDPFHPGALVDTIWGDAVLPDARLLPRLRKSVAMLVERLEAPAASVPRKLLIGAQRFWNNVRVPPASLRDPMIEHQTGLLVGVPSLFVAHDTMEIDLTGRYQPDDAGPLRSSHACGHLLHWALAIDPETRRPLAAVASEVWTRPMTTRKGDSASRPPEERESIKWKREIMASVKALKRAKVRAVITHLLDREGDTHDNLTFARAKGHRIITRAAQEHVIAEAPGSLRKLLESSQGWAGETTCEREVPTKASESAMKEARKAGRAAVESIRQTLKTMGGHRVATLRVRWARVTFTPDGHKKKSLRRKPVQVWVVHVREQDVPAFVEPLEWVLLTTVPVATSDEALWVMEGYRSRWPIEPMHAVLKTGLQVEAHSVTDVASMQRLLAVLLPVSLHLVRWAYAWRADPKALARTQVPADVLVALKSACRYYELPLPRREWTIKDVVLRLAALGGYEHRPDRTPGWLVLWRGWRRLLDYWRLVHFARNASPADLPDKPAPGEPRKRARS